MGGGARLSFGAEAVMLIPDKKVGLTEEAAAGDRPGKSLTSSLPERSAPGGGCRRTSPRGQ
jgi:hypothetical protein